MVWSIEDIIGRYRTVGAARCGMEGISQQQHALQCGELAARAGGPPELVAAALLHDLGHLLAPEQRPAQGGNDWHERVAIPFLRDLFPDAVIEPIRLHVDAKRYLCATQAGYRESLSPASRSRLVLQGGPFSADQARSFIAQPHGADAVALRRWDDLANSPTANPQGWGRYRAVLESVRRSR